MRNTIRIRVSLDFARQLEQNRRQFEINCRKRVKMSEYTMMMARQKGIYGFKSANRRAEEEIRRQLNSYAMFRPNTPTTKAIHRV